jgi:hypothetical protein
MNIALTGALIGAGVALGLLALEYASLRAGASDRVKGRDRKRGFNPTERKRMASLAGFGLLLPPAFAGAFWLLWG